MKTSSIKKLTFTALLTALIFIATSFIRIPLPFGYVNAGDAFIFLAVFTLGPAYGAVASGLGSALADLYGYPVYTLGTLVIKTLMALVAFVVYKLIFKATKKAVLAEIIAGIAGTLIMAFGYFIYEILFFTTAGVAILNAPWNLLQGAVGTVLSVVVMRILDKTSLLEKLQKP